jgi:hypothetical protein
MFDTGQFVICVNPIGELSFESTYEVSAVKNSAIKVFLDENWKRESRWYKDSRFESESEAEASNFNGCCGAEIIYFGGTPTVSERILSNIRYSLGASLAILNEEQKNRSHKNMIKHGWKLLEHFMGNHNYPLYLYIHINRPVEKKTEERKRIF